MSESNQSHPEATTKKVELADVISETMERGVAYVPFGESDEIRLSGSMVRKYLEVKTKSGKGASQADVHRFIMLCKTRALNPWVGDAYLVGFDTKDGPQFNLITSIQALYKRADAHSVYDGLESGLYVLKADGEVAEVPRQIPLEGETIVGAWARVWRKDRSRPEAADVSMSAYRKPYGVWSIDPGGMISKCARAKALRAAFPHEIGDLYTQDEAGAFSSSGDRQASQRTRKRAHIVSPEPKQEDAPPAEKAPTYAADEPIDEPQDVASDALFDNHLSAQEGGL